MHKADFTVPTEAACLRTSTLNEQTKIGPISVEAPKTISNEGELLQILQKHKVWKNALPLPWQFTVKKNMAVLWVYAHICESYLKEHCIALNNNITNWISKIIHADLSTTRAIAGITKHTHTHTYDEDNFFVINNLWFRLLSTLLKRASVSCNR